MPMNEINNAKNTAKNITNPETKFSGYTLEEIRYQRALVALQAEFCKTKMARNFRTLQNSNPLSASSVASSIPGKTGYIASKLLTGLNYLDYAMLGFTVFGALRKVYSFFRRKKK